jgi:polyisoprenoid-binding protein YceI
MIPGKRAPLLFLILLAQAVAARAAEDSYTIDPNHTFPSFEVSHLGFSTQRGRFDRTSGKVMLDPVQKTGSVDITIDADSIDTGVQQLDEVLRGAGFFDVAHFPTLSFRSSDLMFDDRQLVSVEGMLTMLGVSRPITLTVTHYKCGLDIASLKYVCGIDAETTLRRSDYGMIKFVPFVGDEVKLKIQAEATRDR